MTTPNTGNPRRFTCENSNSARAKRCVVPAALLENEANIAGSCQLKAGGLGSLYERFRALHYHDRKTKRHTVPSDSTFYRVMRLIDPGHMESIIARWLLEQDIAQLQRLAVDGKVLCGTGREDGRPLAPLSVVTHHLHTTLRSVPIAECWHLITVERSTMDLTLPKSQQLPETEIAYYVSSRTKAEASDEELLDAIVGHWDAIENGTHRVRDVSTGEDACRIAHPKAARKMVTLHNLPIGLYNRLRVGEKTQAPSLPSWRRPMKLSAALRHILR